MVDKNAFHNDTLQLFNETLFDGLLTIDSVDANKKAIKINDTKYYGFFIKKGNTQYFIEDFTDNDESVLDTFPIFVKKKTETDYNKTCFFFIDDFDSVKIPDTKQLTFKQLVDTIAPFNHTNNMHWLLYKIIMITSRISRVNTRIIANKGFGKDSVINNVDDLIGKIANIYGATFAKLEFHLKKRLLVFNEMGNIKKEDKENLQQFLLAIGAFFNKYAKRSRAGDGTLEDYDLSKQSLSVIYNPPMYYVEKGHEWFDTIFTSAVQDRFIPFYFNGKLDEQFGLSFNIQETLKTNSNLLKDCISTLEYYQLNPVTTNPYELLDDIEFDEYNRRHERSFLTICNYIAEYAEGDEELYYNMINELYVSYKKFDEVLKDALSKRSKQE